MNAKVKISKQKMLIIISTIILSVLAIIGLATAFLLSYNGYSPAQPVVFDDGKNIYISCQANENYNGYRFKFSSSDNEIIIDSKTNIISSSDAIKNNVKLGVTYDISACYLADKEGNNSEYSKEIKWQCCQYLASPKIEFKEEQKLLIWDAVENADFYKVFISGITEPFTVTEQKFDLNSIEGGERTFSVIADVNENKTYLKASVSSNEINIRLIQTLPSFSSSSFNINTKILTSRCSERYENVEIILNTTHYFIKNPKVSFSNGFYSYNIDLSLIYDNQTLIGILPMSKDEFNVADRDNILYITVQLPESSETEI